MLLPLSRHHKGATIKWLGWIFVKKFLGSGLAVKTNPGPCLGQKHIAAGTYFYPACIEKKRFKNTTTKLFGSDKNPHLPDHLMVAL